MTNANAEQTKYWNQQAAPPGERVLDLGCGCGASSLALASRVGPSGRVLGLDVSEPMLARARERAAGLAQVSFRHADVQTAALERGAFDAAFSRFGVMFFEDPQAAFRNVLGALRPGGRLVFVCWRPVAENPWVQVPMAAAL